jgi:ATP-dependent exoDNAse (exonuclease V) beta subunit
MGLREPAVGRGGPDFGSAVARGQIVHDVLEQYRLEAELDGLIDDAVRKWDPDAPAPETPEGLGYRARLRKEIESVANHPAYQEVADLPGARRELGFVHLTGPEQGWQGAIDLAGQGPDGLILLDVKTGGAKRGEDVTAKLYAPQVETYVRAAEAIGGTPVAEFRFHLAASGTPSIQRIGAEERRALLKTAGRREGAVASGEAGLTKVPAYCGPCGFRAAGWCPGVLS